MPSKFIDIVDLHDDQFVGVQSSNRVVVQLKIKPGDTNRLRSTPQGFEVLPDPPASAANIEYWSGTTSGGTRPYSNQSNRVRLFKKGDSGLGIAKIDITTTTANSGEITVATFPSNAPVFDMIVEGVVFYTANNQLRSVNIWMNPGSRNVKMDHVPANTRITTVLTGFLRG